MKKIVEIAIFIGFSFGFAGFSFADQAPHEFLTCGAIKPDKQRLACFDAALERATPDKLARKKEEKRPIPKNLSCSWQMARFGNRKVAEEFACHRESLRLKSRRGY